MKKSFPVNINGRIYYFDEDAYNRLNNYYTNLRRTFTTPDGEEIVTDIENRVSEIIADEHSTGDYSVVTLSDIDNIITRMGQPEEIIDADVDEANSSPRGATPPPFRGNIPAGAPERPQRRLYRDLNDKVIAGVISGLAHYLRVNVTALRIIVVALAIVSYLWPLVTLYLIGWLLIPAAESPRQILEMNGQNVTVGSIGHTTIYGTGKPTTGTNPVSFWTSVGRVFSVLVMSFIGLIGLALGFAMIILLAVSLSGIISYSIWGTCKFLPDSQHPILSTMALLVLSITLLVPAISAVWASCCTLFKVKGVSRRTAIIVAIAEFLLIVASMTLYRVLADYNLGYPHYDLSVMVSALNLEGIKSSLICAGVTQVLCIA